MSVVVSMLDRGGTKVDENELDTFRALIPGEVLTTGDEGDADRGR
jgi:hypothetical protein